MFRSRWLGWATLCLSCGGSPAKPAVTTTVEPASPAQGAEEVRIEPVRRSASELLKRHWIAGSSAEFALYADLGGLARTKSFETFVAAILSHPELATTASERECVVAMLSSSRELALSTGRNKDLLLLRFEPSALTRTHASCLGELARLEPATVEGATEAYSVGRQPLVVQPGLLLFGDKDAVGAALAADAATTWPSALDLAQDEYVAFAFSAPRTAGGHGKLFATAERLRFECEANMQSEPDAAIFEERLHKLLREPPDSVPPELVQLFKAFRVDRSGRRLTTALELATTRAAPTTEIGSAAKLAAQQISEFLRDAKRDEMRRTIWRIGEAYVKSWNEGPGANAKRKLFSLPAVPRAIPSGTPHQSTVDDWKAWHKIAFSQNGRQHYQFEVIAAKDGNSAEVLARGDLDGDGKASSSMIRLYFEAGKLTMDYGVQETDRDE